MKTKAYLAPLLTIILTLGTTSTLADESSIRKSLEAAYPKMHIDNITKTPYGGLYEVFVGGQIIYTDEAASFLLVEGKLVDIKAKRDVTSERMQDLTKIDFSSLPLDQAIKVVKGNGSRKLVVFSDPDCPFCKRLEQKELTNLNDVTIYTFLLPLPDLHPDATNKAKAIWCASDRVKAWNDWVLKNQLVKTEASCETPIESIAQLARTLAVSSTPTLFFQNGKRMLGALPYQDIEKGIQSATKK